MSTPAATAEPLTNALNLKPRRLLACVICQRRKKKCDHKHPCATCVRARVQCVPSSPVSRRRRRRFPERELLERLRKYEGLLRQHNIRFEPLHPDHPPAAEKESPTSNVEGSYDSDDEQPGPSVAATSTTGVPFSTPTAASEVPTAYKAKPILHAFSQEFREHGDDDSSEDEVRQVVFKKAWDQTIESDDHLLFGSRQTAVVNMYTLQPQPVQIFQLWQIYLDNINPLLKVTHVPSLQGRLIEAAGNVLKIKPDLEALMFSIYCTAIMSLDEDDCQAAFHSSKVDLLAKYQLGCQQALLNSRFLRSTSRDCLTALYLYLISVRTSTAPQSLSSMLGIAIRIAQRMGIHSESHLARCTVLEAEMSRRLWWSLILFDSRIGEMADYKATSLLPSWDCRVPLNVNDSDLRQEMKEYPEVQGKSTDALFAAVRSELGDFVRHTTFHLAFFGPARRPIKTEVQLSTATEGSEVDSFAKTIEDNYLDFCDPDNPLHFMTIWTTRGNLAKLRLMEHHFRYSGSPLHQADAQRDAALSYALNMLECNTKLMASPLARGFTWMVSSYFPFMGYIQIAQHLKGRPRSARAAEAWQVMSANYHARPGFVFVQGSFFKLLTNFILQAWEARQAAYKQSGKSLATPRIVVSIQENLAQMASNAESLGAGQPHEAMDMGFPDFPMTIPTDTSNYASVYNMEGHDSYGCPEVGAYPDIALIVQDLNVNHLEWPRMD